MKLLTLSGKPLSWADLHAANERYWARHQRDGSLKPQAPPPASSQCVYGRHSLCMGGRIDRIAHKRARCECPCHEVAL